MLDKDKLVHAKNAFTGDDTVPANGWVSTLALQNTFLVAGGGPQAYATVWTLPTFDLCAVLPTSAPITCAMFDGQGNIWTSGQEARVYLWEKDGTLKGKIETHLKVVYAIIPDSTFVCTAHFI